MKSKRNQRNLYPVVDLFITMVKIPTVPMPKRLRAGRMTLK